MISLEIDIPDYVPQQLDTVHFLHNIERPTDTTSRDQPKSNLSMNLSVCTATSLQTEAGRPVPDSRCDIDIQTQIHLWKS